MIREKSCSLCGKKTFYNTQTKDLKYGYTWGRVQFPAEGAKKIYEETKIFKGLEDLGKITVVDYDRYTSFEYIECEECYVQK